MFNIVRMSCSACMELQLPECVESIHIDGLLTAGETYIAVFENHFSKKHVIEAVANAYTAVLTIDVSEMPEGYFFRGNTYKLKLYASEEDMTCDNPVSICAYETCVALTVYEAEGASEELTISCCE